MEDALCSNPCGLEPMGCMDCVEVTGVSISELYQHNLTYDEDLDDYRDELEEW